MAAAHSRLGKGFSDPAIESARVFRVVLDATAWPGKICKAEPVASAPSPLFDMTADVLLTLVDYDTPLWLDEATVTPEVRNYLKFFTGCPLADHPAEAAFAVVSDIHSMPALSEFPQGTPEYPDRSATIIFQTENLSNETGATFTGPGIQSQVTFNAEGLTSKFWSAVDANHAGFPQGVDLIFTSKTAIAACPRSVTVKIPEMA